MTVVAYGWFKRLHDRVKGTEGYRDEVREIRREEAMIDSGKLDIVSRGFDKSLDADGKWDGTYLTHVVFVFNNRRAFVNCYVTEELYGDKPVLEQFLELVCREWVVGNWDRVN